MVKKDPRPYKMSFSTGGLFVNESIEVARLHEAGEPWEDTIVTALTEGAGAMPKSRWRISSGGGVKLLDAVFEDNPLNDLGQTVWTGDLPPLLLR